MTAYVIVFGCYLLAVLVGESVTNNNEQSNE